MAAESRIVYPSLDGFIIDAALIEPNPANPLLPPVLLVHGITADKDEGGFYRDIALALAERGVPSLRFDLRGHGRSGGTMETVTLYGCVSDIAASVTWLTRRVGIGGPPAIIAASFGGGLTVLYASRHPVARLVLLNPNLDYAENWLEGTDKWTDGHLSDGACVHLAEHGWLPRGEFRMGRALLHEVIHIRPAELMPRIAAPALTIHGTADTLVSFATARDNYRTAGESRFIPVEGADHGFLVPGDEELQDPRTHRFRQDVIQATVEWLTRSP
jgi:pimeloyl-ACP methyl ester carboxylesterase